jgi:hypothetical protein
MRAKKILRRIPLIVALVVIAGAVGFLMYVGLTTPQ